MLQAFGCYLALINKNLDRTGFSVQEICYHHIRDLIDHGMGYMKLSSYQLCFR